MPRVPQSYGSNEDWVAGRTGEKVNDPKATPPPEHAGFYDESRESETNAPDQGGKTSDVVLAENVEPTGRASGAKDPATKVTAQEGGAKRDSFFRRRDYE